MKTRNNTIQEEKKYNLGNLTPFTSETARAAAMKSAEVRREKRTFRELIRLYLSCKLENSDLSIKEAIALKACTDALKGDAKAREWIERISGEFQTPTQKEDELILSNILNPDSAQPLPEPVPEQSESFENSSSEIQETSAHVLNSDGHIPENTPSEIQETSDSKTPENTPAETQESSASDSSETADSENSSRILHAKRENIRKKSSFSKRQNINANSEESEEDDDEDFDENASTDMAKDLVAILDEPIAPNSSLSKREYITRKFVANIMTGISRDPLHTLAFLNTVEQLARTQQPVIHKYNTIWAD